MLEAASAASGKTLSQEIEERLQGSFKSAGVRSGLDKQHDHVQALAALIAMLTEKLEAETKRSWRADTKVCQAIIGGLEAMFAALHHGENIPTSWDEMRDWAKSTFGDMPLAQQYGAFEASKLLHALPLEYRDGPLAWIREKLGIEPPPDWGELMREIQEEEAGELMRERQQEELGGDDSPSTEPKDEEKKS